MLQQCFYKLFSLAFLAYAVAWTVAWMTLARTTGGPMAGIIGALMGIVAMGGLLVWGFKTPETLVKIVAALFATNLAGYFIGEWAYSQGTIAATCAGMNLTVDVGDTSVAFVPGGRGVQAMTGSCRLDLAVKGSRAWTSRQLCMLHRSGFTVTADGSWTFQTTDGKTMSNTGAGSATVTTESGVMLGCDRYEIAGTLVKTTAGPADGGGI